MAIFPHDDWPVLPDDNGAAYRVGYFEGLREGVSRFAIHKNGEMIVGSCGTTLAEALAEIDAEEKGDDCPPRAETGTAKVAAALLRLTRECVKRFKEDGDVVHLDGSHIQAGMDALRSIGIEPFPEATELEAFL